MAFERRASAEWKGDLKSGKGTLKTETGVVEAPYNWMSRFDEGPMTNPEELIGAAHAGCYSMALSGAIGRAGHKAEFIRTTATVVLDMSDGANITTVKLSTHAKVPGMDPTAFQKIAEDTKFNCPVSKALKALDIQLETRFDE